MMCESKMGVFVDLGFDPADVREQALSRIFAWRMQFEDFGIELSYVADAASTFIAFE